jgi:hypothetical protein
MSISKTNIFAALQAVLLSIFFYRLPTKMNTDSTSTRATWADHPCILVTTPQYATRKVLSGPSHALTQLTKLADRYLHHWRNPYGPHSQCHTARLQFNLPTSIPHHRSRQTRIHWVCVNMVPLRQKPPRRRGTRTISRGRRSVKPKRYME